MPTTPREVGHMSRRRRPTRHRALRLALPGRPALKAPDCVGDLVAKSHVGRAALRKQDGAAGMCGAGHLPVPRQPAAIRGGTHSFGRLLDDRCAVPRGAST